MAALVSNRRLIVTGLYEKCLVKKEMELTLAGVAVKLQVMECQE